MQTTPCSLSIRNQGQSSFPGNRLLSAKAWNCWEQILRPVPLRGSFLIPETKPTHGRRPETWGKLVDVPVLGELLADHDLSLATLSSGTPGGARMLNHKAESLGTFRFALHRPDASVPRNEIAEMQEKLGPVPEHQIPSLEWLTYSANAYLNYIELC